MCSEYNLIFSFCILILGLLFKDPPLMFLHLLEPEDTEALVVVFAPKLIHQCLPSVLKISVECATSYFKLMIIPS